MLPLKYISYIHIIGLFLALTIASAASSAVKAEVKPIGQLDFQYDFVDADDRRASVPTFDDQDSQDGQGSQGGQGSQDGQGSQGSQDGQGGQGSDQIRLGVIPAYANTSRVQLRRLRLGVDVKLAEFFEAKLIAALDRKNNDGPAPYADRRDYLDEAWIGLRSEGLGHLRIGYAKLPFGIENATHITELPVIERSAATHYFTGVTAWGGDVGRPYGYVCTPLGLGARGNSMLWQGTLDHWLTGVQYHVAVAYNMLNPFGAPRGYRRQDWGIYAGFAHVQKMSFGDYDIGVNAVWRSQGVAYFPVERQRFAELYAFNPYVKFNYQGFHFLGEYFHGIAKHGQFITGGFTDDEAPDRAANAPTANSHGVNLLMHYDIAQTGFSVVGRYSYLDTGGAGFSSGYFSDAIPAAPQPLETNNFNKAHAIYGGMNYNYDLSYKGYHGVVRFSIGYEFARASEDLSFRELINNAGASADLMARAPGLLDDSRVDTHSVRARIQTFF